MFLRLVALVFTVTVPFCHCSVSEASDAPSEPNPGFLVAKPLRSSNADVKPLELLRKSKRILFLGDSITFAGQYIAYFEAWLLTQKSAGDKLVFNLGLPSETVSGLSEDGHAGGRFPRPDLAERLDRVLKLTKPDLVIACYGINCGIYQPFDKTRFEKFQNGIRNLKQKVEAAGATLVIVTPPSYDDKRARKKFSYNAVLDRYSDWLLSQRKNGWSVIDLHKPMTAELNSRRKTQPDFTFQPDAVHPNESGHWFIATQLIRWFGDEKSAAATAPQKMLSSHRIPEESLQTVKSRMTIRRDAYLSASGHKRPGIRKGLPVSQAEAKASQLTEELRKMRRSEP